MRGQEAPGHQDYLERAALRSEGAYMPAHDARSWRPVRWQERYGPCLVHGCMARVLLPARVCPQATWDLAHEAAMTQRAAKAS
jgi:hypothetical protein